MSETLTTILAFIGTIIAREIIAHLNKSFKLRKEKNNGGTIYDKLHRIETNGRVREEKIKNIEKEIKDIKKDIRQLRKEIRK